MWQAYAAISAVQMLNGINQASSISDQAALSHAIGEMNAKYAIIDSFDAEAKGHTDASRYENVINSTVSEQKSNEIAKGVDTSFGTAKDVQNDTRLTGFLNILDIKNQAHQKALGFQREAAQDRLQGAFAQGAANSRADATRTSGFLNAGSTFLSGYSRGLPPPKDQTLGGPDSSSSSGVS